MFIYSYFIILLFKGYWCLRSWNICNQVVVTPNCCGTTNNLRVRFGKQLMQCLSDTIIKVSHCFTIFTLAWNICRILGSCVQNRYNILIYLLFHMFCWRNQCLICLTTWWNKVYFLMTEKSFLLRNVDSMRILLYESHLNILQHLRQFQ